MPGGGSACRWRRPLRPLAGPGLRTTEGARALQVPGRAGLGKREPGRTRGCELALPGKRRQLGARTACGQRLRPAACPLPAGGARSSGASGSLRCGRAHSCALGRTSCAGAIAAMAAATAAGQPGSGLMADVRNRPPSAARVGAGTRSARAHPLPAVGRRGRRKFRRKTPPVHIDLQDPARFRAAVRVMVTKRHSDE